MPEQTFELAGRKGPRAERDATGLKLPKGRQNRFSWKLALVFVWLATTLALTGWWVVHGLYQLARFSELKVGAESELARWHRMYVSEGATLILLLFAGGAALLYYIATEVRRARRVREFFAAFTHDLKTSLASLRLQAESLDEDLQDGPQARLARRLLKDTVRLSLQLENSLFLASADDALLHIENLDARLEALRIRNDWPDLTVDVEGHATVRADARAFESILKNLIQNAVVHGRASQVRIRIEAADAEKVRIRIEDNGRGFKGDVNELGRMFHRPVGTSGSGIGLYLVSMLTKRMGGSVLFSTTSAASSATMKANVSGSSGFAVDVLLPGHEAIGEES
jgi:hypothetical protein